MRTGNRNFALRTRGHGILALIMITFVSAGNAFSQEPPPDDAAPPPMKILSKGERAQLDSQEEPKRRVELALTLMNDRLRRAEEQKSVEEFKRMYDELGGFHALMDNTLEFLLRENRRTGKALGFFKKYELGLRSFAPRIELIRRDLPSEYDPYVKSLAKYLRDARSRAIEPFYGDTVVPNKRT